MPLVVCSNLGILNPPSGSKATDSFRYFKRLPLELRWYIWELELKHERLLHVEAHFLEASPDDPAIESANGPGRAYEIILTEFLPISKLARISSESRAVASHFYRVQLPCVYRWEGKEDMNGIFYFNPELDTLEIRGKAFSNFAEDLWVHDARHVGLVNLALTHRHFIPESKDEYPVLRRIIPRLKRIVFLYLGGIERMCLGEPRLTDPMDKMEVFRSRPIMPATPKFDRLPCDPRLHIGTSLKKVYLNSADPRKLVRCWFRLMIECNVQHDHEVDYRFLVAFGGRNSHPRAKKNKFGVHKGWRGRTWRPSGYEYNPEITNRHSALSWVRRRDEEWRERVRMIREELEGEREEEAEEDEESIQDTFQELELPVRPAVGFWLFPIEALGPLSDTTNGLSHHGNLPGGRKSHWMFDLSGYKPQLCTTRIHGGPSTSNVLK
ncbi:hypothetical protein CDV36_014176 [Fusarium kuroshium]|uniref:2EXR domain-containing protein n=1 Tax=Fusarium kuroshium TaxID=2010991 RepID=A0A3M2RIX2_9HYPO|nr:hypothetical protein CDV36_014176 [Fusarium kuroshium]